MIEIMIGDCLDNLRRLPAQSVHTCVTSPPYFGLRDYGVDGQIGLEDTPEAFVDRLVKVFCEVRRVLRDGGTLWVNLGDSYAGSGKGKRTGGTLENWQNGGRRNHDVNEPVRKRTGAAKQLLGIPWRVAFALQEDGWCLRQDIIWHKPNPMPESVRDRCTKAHEYIFMFSKQSKYYFDHDAMREPAVSNHRAGNKTHKYTDLYEAEQDRSQRHRTKAGLKALASVNWKTRNRRSVWTVGSKPFKGAHFATFPPDLIEPCILAGCPEGGAVLDPFGGSGTTAGVAVKNQRRAILCELNPDYAKLMPSRVEAIAGHFPRPGCQGDSPLANLINTMLNKGVAA